MKQTKALLPSLALAALCATPALATENGLTEYPIGVNTVWPGLLPRPGDTYFFDYTQYYDAQALAGPNGENAAPGFHADIGVTALRLLHTWKLPVGPFTVTSGIVTPILSSDLHVAGLSGNAFGLLDLTLQPVYLGYVNPAHTLFTYFGIDIFLPTGDYDARSLVNLGNNYYTYSPNGAVTWFASRRFQLSLEVQAEAHTLNETTRYQSGDTINFDGSAEYVPFPTMPKVHLGIQGFYFQQLTDDSLRGARYLDGYRGRAFAIGPQVRYDYWEGGAIALKWQHEFDVENRTRGDRIWLEFAVPIRF